MSIRSFSETWELVEKEIFDYLVSATGGTAGVNAFMAWDWPREMVDDGAEFYQWSFQISGGDTLVPNSFGQLAGGAHHPTAEIIVRAGSESAAMRVAGLLFEKIHGAGLEQIAHIQKAYATGYPQKGRAVRPVALKDGGEAKPMLVCEVTIPLRVVFGAIEE